MHRLPADFSWIDLPVIGDDGWPLETRGVMTSSPGLYFVGLAFQCTRRLADQREGRVLNAA